MQAITGFFATIIGYPMQWIYSVVNNYGISIIVITIIIRLALLPLYGKQIKNSEKTADLQAKVREIQARYANNRQKMNEEINNLYANSGVNPASGCLPLIIQLPLIWGLFILLRNPLTYMTASNMIAAVHESFIWVGDLSQPDPWLLPIVAAITTYFTSSSAGASAGAQGSGMLMTMKYMMPVMIFLMGRSFPAGLTLYWTFGNVVQIIQSYVMNRNKKKKQAKEAAEAEVLKRMKKENAK